MFVLRSVYRFSIFRAYLISSHTKWSRGNGILLKTIEIPDLEGVVRHQYDLSTASGRAPWSEIFLDISADSGKVICGLDFSSIIKENVTLRGFHFKNCIFNFDKMQRSIFTGCTFETVTMHQSNFHHVGDRSDSSDRSLGALFKGCSFVSCKISDCDFVMSKFFRCEFTRCVIDRCDMRNVFWADRNEAQFSVWSDYPEMGDLFESCTLKKVLFGHPVSNIMSLPPQMMIPPSYKSVWDHMGSIQRRLTKLSYMMSEEKSEAFNSSL